MYLIFIDAETYQISNRYVSVFVYKNKKRGEMFLRKIYTYTDENGKSPVLNFIKEAGGKFIKKFDFLIEYVANEKNQFCEPYVKHFKVERYALLYELRLRINGTMIRIIFFCDENDGIVLLHAFYKRVKRDTEQALESSLKILNNILDGNYAISEVKKI